MVGSGDPAAAAAGPLGDDAQAQLRAARDRFVAFGFCWADLLMEVDRGGQVVFAAGAVEELLGRPAASLIGSSFADLAVAEDRPLVGQLLAATASGRRLDDVAVRLIRGSAGKALGQASLAVVGYAVPELDRHTYLSLRYRPAAVPAATRSERLDRFTAAASRAVAAQQGRGPAAPTVSLVTAATGGAAPDHAAPDHAAPDHAAAVQRTVAACLEARALTPDGAIDMGGGRYGIVHAADVDFRAVQREIDHATHDLLDGGVALTLDQAALTLREDAGADEGDLARGLMFVMNRFTDAPEDQRDLRGLADNLSSLLADAVGEVARFKDLLARSAFEMALHPIVSLSDATVHHYEALCRFRIAGEEDAGPQRQIRFAENAGLIHEVDLAMALKALDWLEARAAEGRDIALSVNVSGQSIGSQAFADALADLLDARPWSRGRLFFELTESAQIADLKLASAFMDDLRAKGYRISLDDFGSGAASFEFLSHLDIDAVKIDGATIRSARQAHKGTAFLTALTELCRKLKIAGIAERVDDRETLNFARHCGFDFVQGYLFGRPAIDPADLKSADDIARFLER